jgi:hypothetical protein
MFYCDFLRKIPFTDGNHSTQHVITARFFSGRVAVESYFLVIHKQPAANNSQFARLPSVRHFIKEI